MEFNIFNGILMWYHKGCIEMRIRKCNVSVLPMLVTSSQLFDYMDRHLNLFICNIVMIRHNLVVSSKINAYCLVVVIHYNHAIEIFRNTLTKWGIFVYFKTHKNGLKNREGKMHLRRIKLWPPLLRNITILLYWCTVECRYNAVQYWKILHK